MSTIYYDDDIDTYDRYDRGEGSWIEASNVVEWVVGSAPLSGLERAAIAQHLGEYITDRLYDGGPLEQDSYGAFFVAKHHETVVEEDICAIASDVTLTLSPGVGSISARLHSADETIFAVDLQPATPMGSTDAIVSALVSADVECVIENADGSVSCDPFSFCCYAERLA